MKFGAYTACLHDKTLPEALKVLASMGLTSAEVNSGGFLDYPHIPMDSLLWSNGAVDDYLGLYEGTGVQLTALNCNGNPLHADAEVRAKHAEDIRRSIKVASKLGIGTVITMSGLPGGQANASVPSWAVNPWDSVWSDVLDYQWGVAVPFWKEIDAMASDHGVKVALEMHPHNLAFNPATIVRLVEQTGATNIGAEMDPSHLFWQGMDPVAVVDHMKELIFFAAAKDIRINEACKINGVLDDRFTRVPADENPLPIGGRYTCNKWPVEPSWQFVAVGRGHDVTYWATFLEALSRVDPEMPVNIEHEDFELDQLEGLRYAAETLLSAAGQR
jgi:sugar phosphate isomerase/epimerase